MAGASSNEAEMVPSSSSYTAALGLNRRPRDAPTEATHLLDKTNNSNAAHNGPLQPSAHGTFSPQRSGSPFSLMSERQSLFYHGRDNNAVDPNGGALNYVVGDDNPDADPARGKGPNGNSGEPQTPNEKLMMYLQYYVPCTSWLRQYKVSYISGDLTAALTMATIYIPMALSLASNLAHLPPINGLYSFFFAPMIYALLGSSPHMVVGPEAAGSLLVGTVVKASIDGSPGNEDNDMLHAQIAGVVVGMAATTVLIAGLARLGFLDSVLSRPFLRGFISAVGFVIAVDQLIPELGLAARAKQTGASHGSSWDKIVFVMENLDRMHRMTAIVALSSFIAIMFFRTLKHHLQPRQPWVAYFPDRLLIVVLFSVLSARLDWDQHGIEILGPVEAVSGHLFTFNWPFQSSMIKHIRNGMSTSFLIALLGFFESSVAARGLGGSPEFPTIELSANRELVALGMANLVASCFMCLPAFGGYGRSKVNKSTGGRSPMSSVFLSLITLCSIKWMLPYFYYIPKPVLSSMISVVAWSLIEEAPHDISFFLRIQGWTELALMATIFFSTIFFSLTFGIAIGIGLSLLQVIRHSTRPRIQILGRVPGTNRFDNAELHPERLEFFEGCLIVKIPEPLTFANTGELRSRLRRLERYGAMVHPARPATRARDNNRNVIFDIHGVTSLDGSGTQVLEEIVRNYCDQGVRVFFSRCPDIGHPVRDMMERSGIISMVGEQRLTADVYEAVRRTERAESEAAVASSSSS
ncbi:putative sulfate transporter [Ceratocystis platani]|uniref:Putative sulfate transporter n=1 Tax=Ceratocystis fimbriata f. sp. platani TaxID=88771 RepID=A0A0F8BKH2_CERFI|nr:putative sulfate transporter [Ceratocystis platani]